MITKDPFGILSDSDKFKDFILNHLHNESEVNICISIYRNISLCSLIINYTPNLNHSTYIKGFIYDVLSSLVSIINKRERYLQLNLRSMVEHIARITLNKENNGGQFDETVRRKDFEFLKENITSHNWAYLHNVYINACHFVHSSPIAKLNTSAKFMALLKEDANQSQAKMIRNLHKSVSELMKVVLSHFKTEIENIFFKTPKSLEKILGRSLYQHFSTI